MGEENWTQRQPGSVAGSVVPPPAAEIAPPLPKRITRHKPGQQPPRPGQRPPSAPAQLPESLRSLFKPVLSSAPEATDQVRSQHPAPSGRRAEPAGGSVQQDAVHPDHEAGSRPQAGSTPAARLRRQLSRGQAGPRWRRLAWVAALTSVLVAAGSTAAALSRQDASAPAVSHGGTRMPGTTGSGRAVSGLSEAGTARVRAAAWISREISRGAIVACDAVMCSSLFNDGLPASNLLVISPTSSDPLGADVVVATPVVRSQFGSRLNSVYAPTVLASFGSGPGRVDVRVVAPDGAASYTKTLSADVAARKTEGVLLLRNKDVRLPAHAVVQLAAGWVDPRLLLMLPVLAHQHPVQILAFGDQAPGSSWGVPLTSVEVSGAGGLAGMTDRAYLRWLIGFLRDQRPPYLAASITTSRLDGRPIVTIRFARPSPVDLLPHG